MTTMLIYIHIRFINLEIDVACGEHTMSVD